MNSVPFSVLSNNKTWVFRGFICNLGSDRVVRIDTFIPDIQVIEDDEVHIQDLVSGIYRFMGSKVYYKFRPDASYYEIDTNKYGDNYYNAFKGILIFVNYRGGIWNWDWHFQDGNKLVSGCLSHDTLPTLNIVDMELDNTPTQNSDKLVKSGGVYSALADKQNTLVSGTNIKTINSNSILGSGNLEIGVPIRRV